MSQVAMCYECGGTGEVLFTKERGGPVCNHCAGHGYMTRKIVQQRIAAILDGNSVYMSGPSKGSMDRADKILKYLEDDGMKLWG